VRLAADAGAPHVTPIVLHLRPGAREWFLGWLREAHPELVPRYAELYGRGSYARKDYQARITGQVRELAERFGVGRGARPPERSGARGAAAAGGRSGPTDGPGRPDEPGRDHEQLTLL
jgi:DNA repair photolyase